MEKKQNKKLLKGLFPVILVGSAGSRYRAEVKELTLSVAQRSIAKAIHKARHKLSTNLPLLAAPV